MFLDMSNRIKGETVRNLFLVRIAVADDLEELAPSREQGMLLSHGDSGGGDSRRRRSGARLKKLDAMIRARAARGRNTKSVAARRPR